jgi:hypothetical protein
LSDFLIERKRNKHIRLWHVGFKRFTDGSIREQIKHLLKSVSKHLKAAVRKKQIIGGSIHLHYSNKNRHNVHAHALIEAESLPAGFCNWSRKVGDTDKDIRALAKYVTFQPQQKYLSDPAILEPLAAALCRVQCQRTFGSWYGQGVFTARRWQRPDEQYEPQEHVYDEQQIKDEAALLASSNTTESTLEASNRSEGFIALPRPKHAANRLLGRTLRTPRTIRPWNRRRRYFARPPPIITR